MEILLAFVVSLLTSVIAIHIHMQLLEKRLIQFLETQEKDSIDYLNKVEEIVMEVLKRKWKFYEDFKERKNWWEIKIKNSH